MRRFFACVSLLSCLTAQQAIAQEPASQPLPPTSAPSTQESPQTAPASAPTSKPSSPKVYSQQYSPAAAGLLSLIPGLGHLYLGEYKEGISYLTGAAYLIALSVPLGRAAQESDVAFPGLVAGATIQNLIFYTIFDAYRDTKYKQSDDPLPFSLTHERLDDLITAPFRPKVLRKPWVWAGVPAALIGGVGVSVISSRLFPEEVASIGGLQLGIQPKVTPRLAGLPPAALSLTGPNGLGAFELRGALAFSTVGVGEESLFRGCFQSSLTQRFGKTGGWLAASLLFGSAHIGNFIEVDPQTGAASGFNPVGFVAVPYITMVGAGLGYMYMKTGYRLESGVAAHFWYDFLLFTASFASPPEGGAVLRFSIPL